MIFFLHVLFAWPVYLTPGRQAGKCNNPVRWGKKSVIVLLCGLYHNTCIVAHLVTIVSPLIHSRRATKHRRKLSVSQPMPFTTGFVMGGKRGYPQGKALEVMTWHYKLIS
jgi:hypothetical protein